MALSDFAVFNEYAYTAVTEILDQQIENLVTASEGTILMPAAAPVGDFNESAFFARVAGGLVRRRDPYADGTVAEKSLAMLTDREVKVASGTPPMRIDPGMFRWIQQDPQLAGVTIARQLAPDMMADMLNTGLGVTKVALANDAATNVRNIVGETDENVTFTELTKTASLMGDRSSEIRAWVMHSAPMHGIYVGNLQNNERLFTFGSINVLRDPFGRIMIQSDSPALVDEEAGELEYSILGLTPGAITVTRNNDFDSAESNETGRENLKRTYQAEWSNNYGIKGYAWGGAKAPSDAALLTSANWDRIATSIKDLAGVMLVGRANI
jgi:hypothetical protein